MFGKLLKSTYRIAVSAFLIASLVISLIGCGKADDLAKEGKSNSMVLHTVMMCKYLVYEATDFPDLYTNGKCYREGMEAWEKLSYEEAADKFSSLKAEIEESGSKYPEDKPFVELTLGCLYLDLARYKDAYDCIIDAYVSMQERYGVGSYYHDAAAIALCHYYKAIGDYDRCLKEIQSIRDNSHFEDIKLRGKDIETFIMVIARNIEAEVAYDRGEVVDSYNLYVESLKTLQEAIDDETNNSDFFAAMKVDIIAKIGDILYYMGSDYAETSMKYFDLAITTVEENYTGDYAAAVKGKIMAHKAYRLASYKGHQEEAAAIMEEAVSIQKNVYGYEEYPGLVETKRLYGEFLGFVMKDKEAAIGQLEDAMRISTLAYGYNHPETAKVYESMGRLYENIIVDDVKALSSFLEAEEIYKNLLMEKTLLMAKTKLQLGALYKAMGEEEKSSEYLGSAYEIYDNLGIHVVTTEEASDSGEEKEDNEGDG